jgi:energy-coupling factor transport system ATP-binding protein
MTDATVELGGRTVLNVEDLRVHEGEVIGLMGRNGAGKTTLLRALAGLVPLARGSLSGIARAREDRFKDIAFVPQDPGASLYKERLCQEVDDVLRGTGRISDVRDALSMWGLETFGEHDPRDLSVGERQRAALCALTAGNPRLVLLDEPTRGMDAASKSLLLRNVEQMAADGACVVVASHDVELVASLAQRVVLLAEGEVIADGATRSVLTGSLTFSTQANKLCGGDILTVDEAIASLGSK